MGAINIGTVEWAKRVPMGPELVVCSDDVVVAVGMEVVGWFMSYRNVT